MRPNLEYDCSIWSPFASSTRINKLQINENAALRTATVCTQDTDIQHIHVEILILPIHEHLQPDTLQYKQKNTITSLTQTYNMLQHSKAQNPTIFNNDHYTTPIPTDSHTVTTTDIKQTRAIYIHL